MNSALSTPSYLLALLRELLHVPRALQKMLRRSRYAKRTKQIFCTGSEKLSENRALRFEPKILLISFSRGSGPPLKRTSSGALQGQHEAIPYTAACAPSSLSLRLWIRDAISQVLQTRPYTSSCRVARSFFNLSTGFALLFSPLVRVVRQRCVKTRNLLQYMTRFICTKHSKQFNVDVSDLKIPFSCIMGEMCGCMSWPVISRHVHQSACYTFSINFCFIPSQEQVGHFA